MQKVKRPQHIARKEHARYLNTLESNVFKLEQEVTRLKKVVAEQEQQLPSTPDFAMTFVEKQATLSKHHADLDEMNARLEAELKRFKEASTEDRTINVKETYAERLATLDERIAKAQEFKFTLETYRAEIDTRRRALSEKASDIDEAKANHADRLDKAAKSKQILAKLKQELENEVAAIEAKLYVQKRESEKLTQILDDRNKYMEGVQRHLKVHSLPILTAEVKYLLEEFKMHTPEFMAARAEFAEMRRKYLAASKSPIIKFDALPKVMVGEGELWERINSEAEEMERIEQQRQSELERQTQQEEQAEQAEATACCEPEDYAQEDNCYADAAPEETQDKDVESAPAPDAAQNE